MADLEHPLERRAHLLAGKLSARKEMIRYAVSPAGQRPPFTQQLSSGDALGWWRQHRQDDLGRKVLAAMGPQDVLELDAALAMANEANEFGGGL